MITAHTQFISYLTVVSVCMSILPPCSIVTLLRYVSIELKELLTYLLSYTELHTLLSIIQLLFIHYRNESN